MSDQSSDAADAKDPDGADLESAGHTLMARRFRGFLPVVVDVECGGFNCNTDAILEIAAVLLGFNEQGQLVRESTHYYHVAPYAGLKVEEAALKFTGINVHSALRAQIAKAEPDAFRDMFQHIRTKMRKEECKRAILVGHNAHFDHGFVRAAAERHNLKRNPFHPFSSLDTASMSALCFGQTVLARACDAAGLGFEPDEAHSARYDAEKTADLFCFMVNRWQQLGGWPLSA